MTMRAYSVRLHNAAVRGLAHAFEVPFLKRLQIRFLGFRLWPPRLLRCPLRHDDHMEAASGVGHLPRRSGSLPRETRRRGTMSAPRRCSFTAAKPLDLAFSYFTPRTFLALPTRPQVARRSARGSFAMWTYPAAGTSLLGPRTKRRFFVLYATRFAGGIACYTQEEIGDAVGLDRSEVSKGAGEVWQMEDLPKATKLLRS